MWKTENLSQKHVNLYQPAMFYTPDSTPPAELVINNISQDHIHVSSPKLRKSAAMSISGHKTRSMFDRYNIHDERNQREALRATQAYREQQAAAKREKIVAMQHSSGIN